ncbi:hypothetical protein [Vreelandella populi]|uniref:Peptidase C-terminal archaeal/bacterial domain-containing protein n=1 Tax=Vreelandella populi TaxID=2498858 RepID=A0A3S0YZ38_9GAMM|nr:hypothetical protein [Halomonas populi]RUR39296.1 hypothetical protein ELY25_06545 [Halomonas populi]RUR46408.1 hypothetical protein ELY37_10545 [Halomonas populi]
MAKSSPLALVLVAVGGAVVGFLAAQTISADASSSSSDAQTAEQTTTADALVGLDNVTLGERMRGEITSGDLLNGNDGSRYDRYVIHLEEGDLVEFSLRGALNGIVALYDDQLQLLSNAPTARHRAEQAGDYMVVVSGADSSSYGPYTLNSRVVEISDSDVLTVDAPLDSWLDNTSRAFTLTIEEAGMYQLEMRSDEFDAYLELEGPNGYYREDDDSAGNLDARISDFLAPGDYTVTARTPYNEGSGLFTLSVEPRELPGDGELRNDGSIAPNDSLNGWYSGQDLTYQVEVEEAGMYQIDMGSSDVDAYLVLEGPNGYYREDDDSGGNLDARIADFLEPGTYQLTARTAYGSDSGLFTITMAPHHLPEGVELRNEGAITPDETISGWFNGEPLVYELELDESSLVTLDMRSSDFDAYLELEGEGVAYSDDDGGSGTDARLQQQLLPGSYRVLARGFSAQGSGLFELEVSAEPTQMQPSM